MAPACAPAGKAKNASISLQDLIGCAAFAELPDDALEELAKAGSVTRIRPWGELSPGRQGAEESYYFVLEGQVAAVLAPPHQAGEKPKKGRAAYADADFLGFFSGGDCFADGFTMVDPVTQTDAVGAGEGGRLRCVALGATVLLGLARSYMEELFRRFPAWAEAQRRRNMALRLYFLRQQLPPRLLVQDFYLRHALSLAREVRIVQTDRCIECDACLQACQQRHGHARLQRQGPRLGRIVFTATCRDCRDRPCTTVCRAGAIAFDETCGAVRVGDGCTGCGACAKMCPAAAIFSLGEGEDKRVVKCDGCAGYEDPACQLSCPTGALQRVRPAEIFEDPLDRAGSLRRSFCPTAFVLGLDQHRARAQGASRFPWAALLGSLAIAAVGLECFLRRTMPDSSLVHQWSLLSGSPAPVQFVSGRGLGHVLGYVGTALMLLSIIYPLRSRLNWGAWIPKRVCLSAHIWAGLTGAAFVTYHSLLKLDRWAGLSLYATWLVVVTGLLGRYVFGWVHSRAGIAEAEAQYLQQEHRRLAALCPEATDAGRTEPAHGRWPGAVLVDMVAMLWRDLGDRAGLAWMRYFGLRHVDGRLLRQQALRLIAERARSQRRKRYLDSARRLLAMWNLLHLVLTLIMLVVAGLHTLYAIMYSGW